MVARMTGVRMIRMELVVVVVVVVVVMKRGERYEEGEGKEEEVESDDNELKDGCPPLYGGARGPGLGANRGWSPNEQGSLLCLVVWGRSKRGGDLAI